MAFERFQRVDDLFQRALDLPKDVWPAFLEQHCNGDEALKREVLTLLALDEEAERNEFLEAGAAPEPEPADQVGPYRIIALLGEGGAGLVYHARQERPVQRDVALKIIKAGMDTQRILKRFRWEQRSLARMNHPYIAQVFDAGVTDRGRPFFAMELIQGERFTRYCRRHRLDLDQRLALFEKVCEAVGYSHQKGVIHRDLKPGNILVTDEQGTAVPKVIDFGIAKATAVGDSLDMPVPETVLTMAGTALGTLSYMSPEQATLQERRLDTRTDIYSLGVLLYELLCDELPLPEAKLGALAWAEAFRLIREEEAEAPSRCLRRQSTEHLAQTAAERGTTARVYVRRVRGDLDWITLKCLAKNRDQRYAGVDALLQDLQALRDHRPVNARKPEWRDQALKFIRRHRLAVMTAVTVLAALTIGAAAALVGKVRADRNLTLAEIAAGRATRSQQHLTQFLTSIEPADHYRNVTLRVLLDQFSANLDDGLESDQHISAFLHHTVGATYLTLGELNLAGTHLDKAFQLRQSLLGAEHLDTLLSRRLLAVIALNEGRYAEAKADQEAALDVMLRDLGPDHEETLSQKEIVAICLERAGLFREAEALHREVWRQRRNLFGADDPKTLSSMMHVATSFSDYGRAADAEPLLLGLLAKRRTVLGPNHPDTLAALHHLGRNYFNRNCVDLAFEAHLECYQRRFTSLGADHVHTLFSQTLVATVLTKLRRYDQAAAFFEGNLEQITDTLGWDHAQTLDTRTNLMIFHYVTGDKDQAIHMAEQLYRSHAALSGTTHRRTINALGNYGRILYFAGRYAEAEQVTRETLDLKQRYFSAKDSSVRLTFDTLAAIYEKQGKHQERAALLETQVPQPSSQ